MKILRTTAAALLLALSAASYAGINGLDAPAFYLRGTDMHADANFIGADAQLLRALAMESLPEGDASRAELLLALDALKEGHAGRARDMISRWLNKYPASPIREEAKMGLGDTYFGRSYADALKCYLAVDRKAMTQPLLDDLDYRIGYSALRLADYTRASEAYLALLPSRTYGRAAKFYMGYIAYAQNDFAKAIFYLNEADGEVAPGNMAGYYLSQIYYLQGDYRKAIEHARRLLSRKGVPSQFAAEANRITGECLYLTGKPSEAVTYLRHYMNLSASPLISARYILGLSEYADGNYAAAAAQFRPVTAEKSSMGQNAYVYLGQSLLKTGDTDGAIMAFDRALNMHFDNDARENAYYNYAVAKTRGGAVPFGSTVAVLNAFLKEFPNSRYAADVRSHIITGYMTDNNYAAALEAINAVPNPSRPVLEAKQQVLYTLGTRALAAADTDAALKYLTDATTYNYNEDVAREVDLALGETYLRRADYAKAIPLLQKYAAGGDRMPNAAVAAYDLGYALMGDRRYGEAYTALDRALNLNKNSAPALRADILTRMADCRLYQRNWNEASTLYAKAYDTNPGAGDYALFQQAVIRGYGGNFTGKLEMLEDLRRNFATSPLVPDAMLEMTEAYIQLNRPGDARRVWERLIADYPNTSQGRQAYLQLALAQTEGGEYDDAVSTLKALIAKYPTSDEASQGAESYKHISANRGTLADFEDFMQSVDSAPQTDPAELDRLAYDSAEEAFLDGKGTARLEEYIRRHNNGAFALPAYEYLMDDADQDGNLEKANSYATIIIDRWPDNDAAETAYAIRGEFEYGQGNPTEALRAWTALESRASSPDMVSEARMGIMRATRDLAQPDQLQQAAEAVLASSAPGAEGKTEARFSLGMAHALKGDDRAAIEQWSKIASRTDDLYGAKAAVNLAEKQLENGDRSAAIATAKALTESGTPHTYWLARGFIVLSDALRASGKDYDADEYLRALRQNYPGTEADIFIAIDERLNK